MLETQRIIPTQIIKNELGPKYCPKVSNYIVQQTIPLSIEYDCGHCEYYNGLKDNCVQCAKKIRGVKK